MSTKVDIHAGRIKSQYVHELNLSQGDTKEGECGVLQEVGRDHTEPEFTVFLEAEDDRSNVILTLDVGTVPGGTNVLSGTELGGFSTTLNDVCLID